MNIWGKQEEMSPPTDWASLLRDIPERDEAGYVRQLLLRQPEALRRALAWPIAAYLSGLIIHKEFADLAAEVAPDFNHCRVLLRILPLILTESHQSDQLISFLANELGHRYETIAELRSYLVSQGQSGSRAEPIAA